MASGAVLSALAAVTPVPWCASRKIDAELDFVSPTESQKWRGRRAVFARCDASMLRYERRFKPSGEGGMDLDDATGTQERFRAYAADLASVLGHADRVRPFEDDCTGLLSAEGRKSVEPLPAVTAPERTAAQHQSLLHFVAQAPWSDQAVYEGRGWRGFHHHAALCTAAYGFLISGKETISPLGPARAWRGLQRSQSRERGRPTSRCHQDTKVVGPLPVEHSGWKVSWPITLASGIACMGCCRGCGASATC